MPDPILRAIPYPQPTLVGHHDAILALKTNVELLAGMTGKDVGRSLRYEEFAGFLTQYNSTVTLATAVTADLAAHIADVANPHATTKAQVGLGNADNTSDVNKPVSTAQAAADALKVDVAGDTMTGDLTISKASPSFLFDSPTPSTRAVRFRTNGLDRWLVFTDSSAEGGANAGSIFAIRAYDDAGVSLGNAIVITRATRVVDFALAPTIAGAALAKSHVGLGNVDNTSDVNKPVSTAQAAADALKVAKAGDTMTGNLTISKASPVIVLDATTGTPYLYMNSDTPQTRAIRYQTLNLDRWLAYVSGTAEAGANAGSDYHIARYSDAGASLGSAFWIRRSDGEVTVVNNLDVASLSIASVALAKSHVGLGNVDNTSDVNKPVSTAQQTALNLKANIASPTFTGVVQAPTESAVNNSTRVATTAFVHTHDDPAKANLASPALTGTPTAPTAAANTNTTQLATTAFVLGQDATAAEQEAAASTIKFVTPAVQHRHPSAAKGWLFSIFSAGVPNMSASYNVASITDTGVGIATVVWTTDFSSANYAVVSTVFATVNRNSVMAAITTGYAQIYNFTADTAVLVDSHFSVAAFGDQV